MGYKKSCAAAQLFLSVCKGTSGTARARHFSYAPRSGIQSFAFIDSTMLIELSFGSMTRSTSAVNTAVMSAASAKLDHVRLRPNITASTSAVRTTNE